jgi:molecular chaperone DnaJ
MSKKDYYETLGISRNASEDEIKRAFRRLARQHHPDVNKEAGAEEKFKEINEAYHVLSDQKKRAQYDRFGQVGGPGGFGGGFEGVDLGDLFEQGFGGFGGFGDMFESFFGGPRGGGRRRTGPERGDDLRYDLTTPLEAAATGEEREINVDHLITCDKCSGSRAAPGTSPVKCSTCNGAGQVSRSQRTMLGSFTQVTTCPACRGVGEVISSPCPKCRGNGRMRKTQTVKIKIPPGVDTGHRLRISGAGNAGERGGRAGDLYIFIRVTPHESFERDGADLYYKKKISIVQAALGAEVKVPTIDGTAALKVPSGTQPGTTFRMRGKGMPNVGGIGRGDEYVLIDVEVPTRLSKEQSELLKKFGISRGDIK